MNPAQPDGENETLRSPISADGSPETGRTYTIPARQGRAVRMQPGQALTITNPHGSQVCDFWAFAADDMHEVLSMPHLHAASSSICPRAGDALVSNRRRALLRFVADSSPGVHDTVVAACDIHRYRQLGAPGYHDNCTDNLRMALLAIGLTAPQIPAPFNIWMNTPVSASGAIDWLPPVSKPGDAVVLRAEVALVAVMSACPQDMIPVNGADQRPMPLEFRVD